MLNLVYTAEYVQLRRSILPAGGIVVRCSPADGGVRGVPSTPYPTNPMRKSPLVSLWLGRRQMPNQKAARPM
jgi:hypothetical protein